MRSGFFSYGGVFLSLFILIGCSTVKKPAPEQEPMASLPPVLSTSSEQPPAATENNDQEPPVEPVVEKGVIFGKTDFQGVLQSSYVRLTMENIEDRTKQIQLNIGDKPGTIWQGKTVEPGYFFLDLPPGKYKIMSISIPVGSTLASEQCDITFQVLPNTIIYVGTLQVIGTKERIKLGGIPIIQPGFEYTVAITDERAEGMSIFQRNYPNIPYIMDVQLLQNHPLPRE